MPHNKEKVRCYLHPEKSISRDVAKHGPEKPHRQKVTITETQDARKTLKTSKPTTPFFI